MLDGDGEKSKAFEALKQDSNVWYGPDALGRRLFQKGEQEESDYDEENEQSSVSSKKSLDAQDPKQE